MTPYITVCTFWSGDGEVVVSVPIVSVSANDADARSYAHAVLAHMAPHTPPEWQAMTVVTTPVVWGDAQVRDFLASLRQHRPDLLKTPRGKG